MAKTQKPPAVRGTHRRGPHRGAPAAARPHCTPGGRGCGGEAARQGQAHRARAPRPPDGPGSFVETDPFAVHRSHDFGMDTQPPAGRRRHHRLRHDRRPQGVRRVAGLHGVRRLDGRGHAQKVCKVMDLALQTGAPFIQINDSGGARIQEGAASLAGYGYIFERNVRASRRDPADQRDHGALRRRRRLLPRDHRLHLHGEGDLAHVHHRPRRDQDGDRRGRHVRGARRRDDAREQSGVASFVGQDDEDVLLRVRYLLSSCRRTTSRTRPRTRRPTTPSARRRPHAHRSPTARASPTTCTR